MQEELERKSVVLTTQATKLTARILARLMAAALRKMKESKDAPQRGKQTVKQLAKQNAGLQNVEINDGNIKGFERVARKYGIDFALKKDADQTPPKWLVFFKSRDADALTAAFAEFSRDTLRRERKPSVRTAMRNFREVVRNAVLERDPKHRVRERSGLEL